LSFLQAVIHVILILMSKAWDGLGVSLCEMCCVDISGNVRAWVVNAEQDCFAFHFSQGLWGDSADHVEIKVVGKPARAAVHFLLPHSEPLETLASMADAGQCFQLKRTFSQL
jgi:hypothetical protein